MVTSVRPWEDTTLSIAQRPDLWGRELKGLDRQRRQSIWPGPWHIAGEFLAPMNPAVGRPLPDVCWVSCRLRNTALQ